MTDKLVGVPLWHLERIAQEAKLYAMDFHIWNLARLTDDPQLWTEAHELETQLVLMCDRQRLLIDKVLLRLRSMDSVCSTQPEEDA